jgi:hypothetical protein
MGWVRMGARSVGSDGHVVVMGSRVLSLGGRFKYRSGGLISRVAVFESALFTITISLLRRLVCSILFEIILIKMAGSLSSELSDPPPDLSYAPTIFLSAKPPNVLLPACRPISLPTGPSISDDDETSSSPMSEEEQT